MKKTISTIISVIALTFITAGYNTVSAQNVGQVIKDGVEIFNGIKGLFPKKDKNKKLGTSTSASAAPKDNSGSVSVYTEETSGERPMKIESVHPDLKVRVTRCVAAQKMVMVTMELTDLADQDDRLEFSEFWCAAIDDAGNEHKAHLYSQGEGRRIYNLVSGVKKKIEIRISDVPTSVESIARIVLPIESYVFPKGNIIIRNVPIDRDE